MQYSGLQNSNQSYKNKFNINVNRFFDIENNIKIIENLMKIKNSLENVKKIAEGDIEIYIREKDDSDYYREHEWYNELINKCNTIKDVFKFMKNFNWDYERKILLIKECSELEESKISKLNNFKMKAIDVLNRHYCKLNGMSITKRQIFGNDYIHNCNDYDKINRFMRNLGYDVEKEYKNLQDNWMFVN